MKKLWMIVDASERIGVLRSGESACWSGEVENGAFGKGRTEVWQQKAVSGSCRQFEFYFLRWEQNGGRNLQRNGEVWNLVWRVELEGVWNIARLHSSGR